MKNKIVAGLAIVVVVTLGIFLIKRALESEEDRIRRMIGELESSVESRSTLAFIGHVHRDFEGRGRGHGQAVSYDLLKAAAHTTFKSFKVVELEITEPQIKVDPGGETATAYFNCKMIVRSQEGSPGEDMIAVALRAPLIVLKLKKASGRWIVMEAEYGPDAQVPFTLEDD